MNVPHHPFPTPPGEGHATEVAPGILWLRLPLPMALDHVNCYALADDDGWTLVDTGISDDLGRAVWQALLGTALRGKPVTRLIVTHHHPDHIGGSMMGFELKGLAELLERVSVPVHVNTHEAQWVSRVTGIPMSDLTSHEHGDKVSIGDIDIELLHTPGHTPGSQCFLVDGRLVAGDTLFLDGCGRTDFPGGDVDEMFRSLQQLAKLTGDPTVFPGHGYSAEGSASLSDVKNTNYVYKVSNIEQWRSLMGG